MRLVKRFESGAMPGVPLDDAKLCSLGLSHLMKA
jgi:hypothetical protein